MLLEISIVTSFRDIFNSVQDIFNSIQDIFNLIQDISKTIEDIFNFLINVTFIKELQISLVVFKICVLYFKISIML